MSLCKFPYIGNILKNIRENIKDEKLREKIVKFEKEKFMIFYKMSGDKLFPELIHITGFYKYILIKRCILRVIREKDVCGIKPKRKTKKKYKSHIKY
jgi:hypothetical protein